MSLAFFPAARHSPGMRMPQWLLLVSALWLAAPAHAESVPTIPDHLDAPSIDAWLAGQVHRSNQVGVSVAILKDGELLLAKGYGQCALPNGQPITPDTLFAIGSVTKQFTCACILLLAEDGQLSVRDPVAKYFPDLTRAQDVTLLDLMNHVSGYRDYYPLDFVDRRMLTAIGEDQLLRQYAGGKLDFEPGTKWSYSNTGYILLGRIVQKVSGESMDAFLTRRIFKPLGLTHTLYEPDPADSRLARGHATFALSNPELVAPEAKGWLGAAGGIYSTPSDLVKWDLALINGTLLKPESFELMSAPRRLSDGRLTDYGCGLAVRTQEGRLILSHSGAVSGFNAWGAMIPSTRTALIVMGNVEGAAGPLADRLFPLLVRTPSKVPTVNSLPAIETVQRIFEQFQKGRIDRRAFSDDFNEYLSDARLAGASRRLRPFGRPTKTERVQSSERGGLEVTVTRLTFKKTTLRVLMYRNPNGAIEQFFVDRE